VGEGAGFRRRPLGWPRESGSRTAGPVRGDPMRTPAALLHPALEFRKGESL